MKSIRGSLGGAPKSNFFSFQDIIMSVTGILIVIALMLALQIDKVSATPQKSASPQKNLVSDDVEPASATPEELARLEKEILVKKGNLEAIQSAAQTRESEAEIKQEIVKLEDQITRLSKQENNIAGVLPENIKLEEIKSKAAEIMRLRHEIQAQEDKLGSLMPSMQEGSQKVIELENKVKAAEAAVAQVRLEKRKLKLIRELSDTTKEPIIVDVSENRIVVMRFDKPEPLEMASEDSFKRYLKVCKKEEQYFVLYFRPSGAPRFDTLREIVKSAGFEVGYDATEENTDLTLGKGDKQ